MLCRVGRPSRKGAPVSRGRQGRQGRATYFDSLVAPKRVGDHVLCASCCSHRGLRCTQGRAGEDGRGTDSRWSPDRYQSRGVGLQNFNFIIWGRPLLLLDIEVAALRGHCQVRRPPTKGGTIAPFRPRGRLPSTDL